MRVGETVALPLKPGELWSLEATPDGVIAVNNGEARAGPFVVTGLTRGRATVTAVGFLACHFATPPCAAPNPGISFVVVVE